MDHMRILRRALNITLNYRVLWIFGILVALSVPRGGGNNGGGGSQGGSTSIVPPGLPHFYISQANAGILIGIGIALLCFVFLLAIAFAILRYVSETAMIRMVDDHEATGEKLSFSRGFRLGWSRGALRIFLINLIFGVGLLVVFVLLLVITLAPLLLWLTRNNTFGLIGTVATIGFLILFVLVAIIVAVVYSVLKQFMWRAAVLEDLGVFAAIERGARLMWQRIGDVAIMALILFGLGLLLAIVMIPVVILLVMVGLLIGGIPALMAGGIASLFTQNGLQWAIGFLIGLPIFFLVLFIPLLFIGGLTQVYTSTTWTLTYREALALEVGAPESTGPLPSEEGVVEEPLPETPPEDEETSPL